MNCHYFDANIIIFLQLCVRNEEKFWFIPLFLP